MAALESGFGFTRTALFANNLFGWKYTSAGAADGRESWKLACQPASDPGNRYIVFQGKADSVAFVAGRLASNTRYALVTRQYQQDRTQSVAVNPAVERWVRDIAAAGYNPYPAYPSKVLSIARNFRKPGTSGHPQDSLFRYSENTVVSHTSPSLIASTDASGPTAPTGLSASERAALDYLRTHLARSRYLATNCGAAILDWPDYVGRPVRRCSYSATSGGKTLTAIVYLLNPDAANIAARIDHACAAISLADRAACGLRLARMIIAQNGGQFPVAGLVIERKQDSGGHGPDPVYLEFRDGVTVITADRLNYSDRQLTDQAMDHAARAPVVKAQRYARIANADRQAYRRAGGLMEVGSGPADDAAVKWPAVIRANELEAQRSGRDMLLVGVAMGMMGDLSR